VNIFGAEEWKYHHWYICAEGLCIYLANCDSVVSVQIINRQFSECKASKYGFWSRVKYGKQSAFQEFSFDFIAILSRDQIFPVAL